MGSIARQPAFRRPGLWLWLVLCIPLLWRLAVSRGRLIRDLVMVFFGLSVFGSIIIFGVQMTTMPNPQNTYFITPADARFAKMYYDKFPAGTQILDRTPYRAVTIFGRAVKAYESIYDPLPGWPELISNPDPEKVLEAGYQYIYMDDTWWKASHKQHVIRWNLVVRHMWASPSITKLMHAG